MSADTYRLLHLVGVLMLFLGLGGMLAREGRPARPFLVLHGAGLLLVLIAGFGVAAMRGLGMPLWMIVKVVLWLGLAFLPTLIRRGTVPHAFGWLVAIGLGALAAWLAQ